MRTIKLHFTDPKFLEGLLNDDEFMQVVNYLNPQQIDKLNLILTDPVETHNPIDSEQIVLQIFIEELKRIFYPTSPIDIEYLSSFEDQPKGGLKHNAEIIIDSIDIQITI